MRGLRSVAVAVGLSLAGVGTVRAGIYNPAEPEWDIPPRFEEFRSTVLIPIRQFGTAEAKRPMHRRAALAAQVAQAGKAPLTAEQRLSLSAYLLRAPVPDAQGKPVFRYREAINLLTPLQRDPRERDNFLVYANLATAEYLDGQRQRARDYLADALRMWPQDWSRLSEPRRKWLQELGWDAERFKRYRQAETYFLKLLRLRARERPAAQAGPLGTEVEPLFDDGGSPPRPVRFVGEDGKYQAGAIAAAEAKKLPADAARILEQLLIWLPHDDRLYWLLGEVLNAQGQYVNAAEIFTEIGDKVQANSFAQTTATAPERVKLLSKRSADEFTRLPELHRRHLAVVLDKIRSDEKATAARDRQAEPEPQAKAAPALTAQRPPARTAPTGGGSLPIDMRSLGVGFVAGLIVMVFALWQVREVRRRLQARSAPHARQEGRPG